MTGTRKYFCIKEMNSAGGESGSNDEEIHEPPEENRQHHRHSLQQIQQLEEFFKVNPHPNKNQRQQLSTELSLEPNRIKFWFQNKRTQTKAQNNRADNTYLEYENEILRCENLALREVMKSSICPSCRGVGLGEEGSQLELQRLKLENIQLKEEYRRVIDITSSRTQDSSIPLPEIESLTNKLGYPFIGGEMGVTAPNDHELFSGNSQAATSHPRLCEAQDMDRSTIIQTAITAMDELVELLQVNEPFWIKSSDDGSYLLRQDRYDNLFPKVSHCKSSTARIEATKDSGEVLVAPTHLIEMLLDSNKWKDLFPSIVIKARTIEVIDTRNCGGSLNLMYEKMHILSPVVATREFYFIRYFRQLNSNTWVMVDMSNDFIKELQDAAPFRSWKLPSGCMIQDMSNGKSMVTWIEHVIVDDISLTHRLYRDLVFNCHAFGAKRWIVNLQRMCERLAFSMGLVNVHRHELEGVIDSPGGQKNLMKLSHRMVKSFYEVLSMSDELDFPHLSASNNSGIRVSPRRSSGPGEPNGLVVCASTSLWLPVCYENLFRFLKDERKRAQWEVLSSGSSVNLIAQIATGMRAGNCISIVQPYVPNESNMLMLQETSIDSMGAMMIYAPIELRAITSAVNGEDTLLIPILPSGYVISPDGRADSGIGSSTSARRSNSKGSLLTVAFQILVCCGTPSQQQNMESIAAVQALLSSTIQKIKQAPDCSESD